MISKYCSEHILLQSLYFEHYNTKAVGLFEQIVKTRCKLSELDLVEE